MDFDIAGLLANPDFQYMLAGLGGAGGAAYNNPFAQAAGGITMQGIGAKNQAALLARLLGQGGKGEAFGANDTEKNLQAFLNAHPETNMRTDGNKMTLSGPKTAFDSFGGGGTTPAANSSMGGQSGIINPSVGLPGDLSGLSLAGLKPEDINKALALGLTGADLERKRVSDLFVNEYHRELIEERRAARGAKDVTSPVELPGVGPISLEQFKALKPETKAYAYAMQLRKQNGQPIISPERFKLETNPSDMEKLARAVMADPGLMKTVTQLKQAGATQINLGDKAALQRQTEGIKNFNTLKDPKFKGFEISEDEQYALAAKNKTWIGDPKFAPILTKAKIDRALTLIKGTNATIHKKDVKVEGNEIVVPVTTAEGVEDVIRRPVK